MNYNSYLLAFLLILCFVAVSIANFVSTLPTLQPVSCHDSERSALLQFKQSIFIDCALASGSPHAYPTTSSWTARGEPNDGNCCLWEGVNCNKVTGHVTGLDLSSSCLYGSFPPNTSLFNLPYLEELSLYDNHFNRSPIPSGVGHKLSKLRSLNLSFSEFSGEVPSDISKMSRLSLLDLSDNYNLKLKALGLERLVQNLTHLNQLILDSVDISSSVPNLLANVTSLKIVSLDSCNLQGEFPTSMFYLPHLEILVVSGNLDLTGYLPKFEHSSPLKNLDISYTSFSGRFPPSIGLLAHMEQLNLIFCQFSRGVPSSLGNLIKLNVLLLEGNNFSGDMPSSFTNLTQLRRLGLSDLNATPDKLFPWLSKLNNLIRLTLGSMNITGEIPSVFANFTSLQHFSLEDNKLTGHIPNWLMNHTNLRYLLLSGNHLEGSLSHRISQLQSLVYLDLNGNDNLHINFDTLLKIRSLKYLRLDGLQVTFPTFPGNITTNRSVAKFSYLSLNSCNLTQFPPFLQNQDKLVLLILAHNNFQGVIPQWFINVTGDNLLLLDLSFNFLEGFEKPVKLLPWRDLEELNLKGNKFQGSLPIPSKFIRFYQVSNNSFTGPIPRELCHTIDLNYLDLSFNNLNGQIPECIIQPGGSLYILNVQGNKFHNTIPNVFNKSCKLKMINLGQNRLKGNLPRSLSNCRMLEVLDIGSNQINDTFPSWLGSLPNLQILVLRHNNFHGGIGKPDANFGFRSLRVIDLSHNFHTGGLPSDYLKIWDAMKNAIEDHTVASGILVNVLVLNDMILRVDYNYTITITNKGTDTLYPKILNVFRVIDFSSNNFTGRIPDFIGQLSGLQAINLSNNNLEGGIPSSLANMKDLESLDLLTTSFQEKFLIS